MNKKIYILLIAFGFFMIPNAIFACNTSSHRETCKEEMSSNLQLENISNHDDTKNDNHNCCDKNSSKQNNNKDCNGKCGHSNCTTSNVQFAFISSSITETTIENVFFFSNKVNFSYLKTNLSDGFYNLWLIPKIG